MARSLVSPRASTTGSAFDHPRHMAPQWHRFFCFARLEKEGLSPAPEADRTTLIRRVTLDLTGLAPTPAEVEAFLADSSPDAYQRVVDRLLHSPRYGERMAVDWMDAARYADTNGFQVDRDRECGPGATGLSTPSITICLSIDSRSSNSRATSYSTRRVINSSPPACTATA